MNMKDTMVNNVLKIITIERKVAVYMDDIIMTAQVHSGDWAFDEINMLFREMSCILKKRLDILPSESEAIIIGESLGTDRKLDIPLVESMKILGLNVLMDRGNHCIAQIKDLVDQTKQLSEIRYQHTQST